MLNVGNTGTDASVKLSSVSAPTSSSSTGDVAAAGEGSEWLNEPSTEDVSSDTTFVTAPTGSATASTPTSGDPSSSTPMATGKSLGSAAATGVLACTASSEDASLTSAGKPLGTASATDVSATVASAPGAVIFMAR